MAETRQEENALVAALRVTRALLKVYIGIDGIILP
jgi:hypothetical protein